MDLNGQIVSNSFDVQGGVGGGGALKNTSGTLARLSMENNGTVKTSADNDASVKIGGMAIFPYQVPITECNRCVPQVVVKGWWVRKTLFKSCEFLHWRHRNL